MRTKLTKRHAHITDLGLMVDYQFDDGAESLKDEPHHIRWNQITVSGTTYNDAVRNLRNALEKQA